MIRSLHHLIVIVTALALVVTSAGWSVASAEASFNKAAHQFEAQGSDAPYDHHGVKSEAGPDQFVSDETTCGKAAAPEEGGCCAMACHVAVETKAYSILGVGLPRSFKTSIRADDVATELLTCLERPPRRVPE
jgi:hypothetical protein